MQRVMVIGCCGAGKSTFSRHLHAITNLEIIHLDQYFWQANWTASTPKEWQKRVTKLAQKPNWIIDGNYGGTINLRIERADTIIYLDAPTLKCLWRVIWRTLKNWRSVRPDMPEGCEERFDLGFLHYVATFNWVKRGPILKKIKAVERDKTVVVLPNQKAIDHYLNTLKQELSE